MRCDLVCCLIYCGSQLITYGWVEVSVFFLNIVYDLVFAVAPVLVHSSNYSLFHRDGLVLDALLSLSTGD